MSESVVDRVEFGISDGVARIELARPDVGNRLDEAMARALRLSAERLRSAAAAGDVRVAVIAARGKVFSVGGDLGEFAAAEDRAATIQVVADELHAALRILEEVPVPVVSVVQGTAAGGGLGFALIGDIVLVAAEAKLVMAYTASGLTPDCGATWVIPRRVSRARAMDLALLNRVLTGEEAAAWGLASRAVPAADLPAEADKVVAILRDGPAGAFAGAKKLINESVTRSRAEQMDVESRTIGRIVVTPDAVEGVDAFLAKRPPVYR